MAGLVPGLVPAIHVVQSKKWKRFATILPWRSTSRDNLLKYWRPTEVDGRDKPGHEGRSGAGVAGVGIPHSPASGATGLEIGLSAGDGAAAPATRSRSFWKTT